MKHGTRKKPKPEGPWTIIDWVETWAPVGEYEAYIVDGNGNHRPVRVVND